MWSLDGDRVHQIVTWYVQRRRAQRFSKGCQATKNWFATAKGPFLACFRDLLDLLDTGTDFRHNTTACDTWRVELIEMVQYCTISINLSVMHHRGSKKQGLTLDFTPDQWSEAQIFENLVKLIEIYSIGVCTSGHVMFVYIPYSICTLFTGWSYLSVSVHSLGWDFLCLLCLSVFFCAYSRFQ